MRIAFYVHGFPHFHNTFIHNEIAGLTRIGHDVRIYSCFNPNPGKVNSAVARFGLDQRVTYLSRSERQLLEPLWTATDLRAAWDALGPEGRARVSALPVARDVAAADLIHAAFANNSATVGWLLAQATGRPFSFEAHAYDLFVDFPHASTKLADAAAVFPETEYNRAYLLTRFQCDPSRLVVKRLTFDRTEAQAVSETRQPGLVVSVGRLHPIKGFDVALRAVGEIARSRPDVRYVIAGDGPLRAQLESQAAALGLDQTVCFLGDISNAEVLRWLARANVCLMPSVQSADGDRDGIPTVLYESTFLGTPIVSSRISGIPELVKHQVTGWLAEPGDVDGVAAGLRWFLDHPQACIEAAARARKHFSAVFDVTSNLQRMSDALGLAVRRHRARAPRNSHDVVPSA